LSHADRRRRLTAISAPAIILIARVHETGGIPVGFERFIAVRQIFRGLCLAGFLLACSPGAAADESNASPPLPGQHPAGPVHEPVIAHPPLDRSGSKRRGKASFYAREFSGRKMADGTTMQPQGDNAASKTLPLGTTAKVTNLETGRSAVVTIRDRGPYIQGRIVDLSPATAEEIGIEHKKGVAKVEVAPIVVPLPDGRIKLGAAAMDVHEDIESALSNGSFTRLANFPHLAEAATPAFMLNQLPN
jgi:rare lipoprotein A